MRHAPRLLILASAAAAPAHAQAGPTVQGRIFADLNYVDTQRQVAEGFRSGQVAGHLASSLSDRVTFFGEASATATSTGFSLEIERAILRYDHADFLRLSAGRYHTPVSYWNTAFHHGQWLQTSIARPELIRGGGSYLPVHFVGAMAEGSITAGPTRAGYHVGVGNGRGANIVRGGDAGDANGSRAALAGATLHLPRSTGVQLGVSYYADRATPSAGVDVDERIVSAYVAAERETPEVIVEYARVGHEPRGGAAPATVSNALYGQIGYRLPGRASALKPYARVERLRVPAADVLFGPLKLDYDGTIAGLRLDLATSAAMKLEYRSERFALGTRLRTLAAQLSFTIPGIADTPTVPTAVAAGEGEHAGHGGRPH